MTLTFYVVFLLVAVFGTAVVVEREPLDQLIMLGVFGLVLGVAFLLMQAPDVALSEFVVGAVALPLLVLLALTKVRGDKE
jgi:uncharacterized MnhB-related membrane protein